MANSADPDLFRSQLIWICTVCKGRVYLGSAGHGLKMAESLPSDSSPHKYIVFEQNLMTYVNCIKDFILKRGLIH